MLLHSVMYIIIYRRDNKTTSRDVNVIQHIEIIIFFSIFPNVSHSHATALYTKNLLRRLNYKALYNILLRVIHLRIELIEKLKMKILKNS